MTESMGAVTVTMPIEWINTLSARGGWVWFTIDGDVVDGLVSEKIGTWEVAL